MTLITSDIDPSWPSKESDINFALKTIQKHYDKDGHIKFIESFEEHGDDLAIVMPKWLMDLNAYFTPIHGERTADIINQIIAIIFKDVFSDDVEKSV